MLCMLLRRGQADQQLQQQLLTALYQCPVSVIQQKTRFVLKLAKSSSNQKFCQEAQGLVTAICRAHGLPWGCAASLGDLSEITCGTGDCNSRDAASELARLPFLLLLQSFGHGEAGQQSVFALHGHSLRQGLCNSIVRQTCQFLLRQHDKLACMTYRHTTVTAASAMMHCNMSNAELLFVNQSNNHHMDISDESCRSGMYID